MGARGRPQKLSEEKIKLIQDLAFVHCTKREISIIVGISEDALVGNPVYAAAFQKGHENGKITLRKAMFKSALGGNVTAQIWLSKQLLGYSDKAVIDSNNRISLTLNYRLDDSPKTIQMRNDDYEERED